MEQKENIKTPCVMSFSLDKFSLGNFKLTLNKLVYLSLNVTPNFIGGNYFFSVLFPHHKFIIDYDKSFIYPIAYSILSLKPIVLNHTC